MKMVSLQMNKGSEESEEVRLLEAIDAQVQMEIHDRRVTWPADDAADDRSRRPAPASHDPARLAEEMRERRSGSGSSGHSDSERERQRRDVEVEVRKGRSELEVAGKEKRREEAALLSRQEGEDDGQINLADLLTHNSDPVVARGLADKRNEERELQRRAAHNSDSSRPALREREGQTEEDAAGANDSALERRLLAAQMAKEKQRREQEREEAVARREAVLAAAEARREASLQRERERRLQMEQERRETQAKREAERQREARLRKEAELRQQEQLQREADYQKKAQHYRELEMRRERELQKEQEREAEIQRELKLQRKLQAEREEEQDMEEQQHRDEELELEEEEGLLRQADITQARLLEAQAQEEVEEAIARAGGPQAAATSSSSSTSNALPEPDPREREVLRRGRELEMEAALDAEPLSHRAQLLSQALEQETAYRGCPDLQHMWEHFMAGSQEPESSLSSERLGMLADLLRDPSQHLVHSFLAQRHLQHQEDLKRAAMHRETVRQAMEEERAALEREGRRQSARRQQQRQSSEEESNGSYGELLQQRERERLKRREQRSKKTSKSPSPSPASKASVKSPTRPATKGNLTADTLYSIPEDVQSQEATPLRKSRSPHRSQSQRRTDVIDPQMSKLRQRIAQQREKLGHARARDMRRKDKLEKLKALLKAKCAGLLDKHGVAMHLASISSTSAPSSDDSLAALSHLTASGSTDSTTAKDSSTEMRLSKLVREQAVRHSGFSLDSEDLLALMEDSSTLTEMSDDYPPVRTSSHHTHSGSPRKRLSPAAAQPSKHGGKFMKLHQTYGPYARREYYPEPAREKTKRPRSPLGKDVAYSSSSTKDFGMTYPSPKQFDPRYHHRQPVARQHHGRLVTRGIQTSPEGRGRSRQRSHSPFFEERSAVSTPYMQHSSRGMQTMDNAVVPGGRVSRQGGVRQCRSISPAFDSHQVAACLSPDRDRPHSASPSRSQRAR
jgi:hypothetical protein